VQILENVALYLLRAALWEQVFVTAAQDDGQIFISLCDLGV